MYIAGLLRTASRPSRTVIDSALYSAFALANFEPLKLHPTERRARLPSFGHNAEKWAYLERKMGSRTNNLFYHFPGRNNSGKTQ
jgi:hypothetical protein